MLKKIKNFFIRITPSKRKIIQLYAALLYNANIKGYLTGKIFTGNSKVTCLPGLNCYSCPGAVGACPLGSIQNALAASKTKLPTYVLGIILLLTTTTASTKFFLRLTLFLIVFKCFAYIYSFNYQELVELLSHVSCIFYR